MLEKSVGEKKMIDTEKVLFLPIRKSKQEDKKRQGVNKDMWGLPLSVDTTSQLFLQGVGKKKWTEVRDLMSIDLQEEELEPLEKLFNTINIYKTIPYKFDKKTKDTAATYSYFATCKGRPVLLRIYLAKEWDVWKVIGVKKEDDCFIQAFRPGIKLF